MIVIMGSKATQEQIEGVVAKLKTHGCGVHISQGEQRTVIGAIGGDKKTVNVEALEVLPGVEKVVHVLEPYKLASRQFHPEDTVIDVCGVPIGGNEVVVMAGPCAVESKEQLFEAALAVKQAGAKILRGGAFKPRTSPYSFQGHAEEGLKMLAEARELTGMPIVTEVMDTRDVELVAYYADILQIGARNAQNFSLLREVGKTNKPVLLKRGMSGTIEDWLLGAEYIMAAGNPNVILGERGIRTFETKTRNTLDLSAIPVIEEISHLPIMVDPSHGTGKWQYVPAMAKAALAGGADVIMIEVHPNPAEAWSDGPQSLNPERFRRLMGELEVLARAVGRCIGNDAPARPAAQRGAGAAAAGD